MTPSMSPSMSPSTTQPTDTIYKFIDNVLMPYPSKAILASWNNGDPNPDIISVDCSKIPIGNNMNYNLSYYGIVPNKSFYSVSNLISSLTSILSSITTFQTNVVQKASEKAQQYMPIYTALCTSLQNSIKSTIVQLNKENSDTITNTDSLIQYYTTFQSLIVTIDTAVKNTPQQLKYADSNAYAEINKTMQNWENQISSLSSFNPSYSSSK
jgi:hypothetical protein